MASQIEIRLQGALDRRHTCVDVVLIAGMMV
jgi:hypothetical protein